MKTRLKPHHPFSMVAFVAAFTCSVMVILTASYLGALDGHDRVWKILTTLGERLSALSSML